MEPVAPRRTTRLRGEGAAEVTTEEGEGAERLDKRRNFNHGWTRMDTDAGRGGHGAGAWGGQAFNAVSVFIRVHRW